jgi:Phage portal protein, SPP1 Gp6-like
VTTMLPVATLFSTALFGPPSRNLGISDVEQRVMDYLAARLLDPNYQSALWLSQLYYDGLNTVPSLGIAVPPELEQLRAVLGWCAAGVDARSERLTLQGFRMPEATEVDDELLAIWQENNLDAESVLVHNDALIYGRSFVVVGVDSESQTPLTTVESPLNMMVSLDVRRREVSAAYHTYLDFDPASETYGKQLSTLYTRDAIVQLVADEAGWQVQHRNDHRMGFVPVIMFANNPSTSNRYGSSEISATWRNTQDRAARALVRNELAAEFFASMKVWLLGVTESAFVKSNGDIATAWETFTGRISALDADKNGNLPQVVLQQGQDPSGMIKFVDHERQVMASCAAVPLEYLGMHSDGNPTSADAIIKGDYRLMKRSQRLITQFGNGWEDWARMVLRVRGGPVAPNVAQLESDWARPTIPTPNADATTVTMQIGAGMIPPSSDDALAACGWSPVQRRRIAADLDEYQSKQSAAATPAADPRQPLDGEQPAALNALQQRRNGVIVD